MTVAWFGWVCYKIIQIFCHIIVQLQKRKHNRCKINAHGQRNTEFNRRNRRIGQPFQIWDFRNIIAHQRNVGGVGRTTFYAHFETKDDLLKELCEDLFGHIISSTMDCNHTHGLYSDGNAPESVFCHLLQHLQENDSNIIGLLSCESNEIFLRFFKDSLNGLVRSQFVNQDRKANTDIPQDFLINHISGSFVEMVLWWIKGRMKQTSEELDRYFRAVIEPIL